MDPSLYPLAALQMQYNNPQAPGYGLTPTKTADSNDTIRQQMQRNMMMQQMQQAGNTAPTSSPTQALARAMGGLTGPMMMQGMANRQGINSGQDYTRNPQLYPPSATTTDQW